MIDITDEQWSALLDTLRTAGRDGGALAASWWEQDAIGGRSRDPWHVATATLNGLEDGDPQVLDTLPWCDLSGEWADVPGMGERWDIIVAMDAPEWDDLTPEEQDEAAEAYREAYDQSVQDTVAAYCRAALD